MSQAGGGGILAQAGLGCSPDTAAPPHLALCWQKCLLPPASEPAVSNQEEAGLGSKQGERWQDSGEGGSGAKKRLVPGKGGKEGRNAEGEEELDVDEALENSAGGGSGFDTGLHAASTHANSFVFGRCP